RRKAPLDVEGEVVELAVEAQPLVAAVAVADDPAFGVIDMPLRDLAHGMIGRNGDARPGFLLADRAARRKEFDGLRRCGQRGKQNGEARQAAERGDAYARGFDRILSL